MERGRCEICGRLLPLQTRGQPRRFCPPPEGGASKCEKVTSPCAKTGAVLESLDECWDVLPESAIPTVRSALFVVTNRRRTAGRKPKKSARWVAA